MNTVVFLDLDGTLWEAGIVPDSARRAIAEAQGNGHKFLTNTGRARSEVPDLTYLDLDGYCFAAGAEVILDGQTIVDERLGAERARQIAAVFDDFGLNYNFEGGDTSWVVVNDEDAYASACAMAQGTPDPILFVSRATQMQPHDFTRIHKMFYHSGNPNFEQVKACMPNGVTLTNLGFGFAEATRADVSKATAIEAVRHFLGEGWRTLAIGDSDNDLSMLAASDVSVAMGNGNENAKRSATWTTTAIDDDGLANALRHFGLM